MTNMICLVGRLNKEIEVIELENDKKYILELAVSRTYKNINGEYEIDLIPIVLWNGIVSTAIEYLHKGYLAGVKGRVQSNENGIEIIAEKVTFLSSKKEN